MKDKDSFGLFKVDTALFFLNKLNSPVKKGRGVWEGHDSRLTRGLGIKAIELIRAISQTDKNSLPFPLAIEARHVYHD